MSSFPLCKLLIGISVFAFTFFQTVKSNAQFLNKNATWTIRSVTYGDAPVENYEDIQILKDSVINGINYSLFEFWQTLSAVREDSNRVYYKVLNLNFSEYDTLEHILYDFNLLVGDSILLNLPANGHYSQFKWVVREVDSILVGVDLKKRLLLEYPDGYAAYVYGMQHWIEDVGSTQGPLCFMGISEHEWEIGLFCYRLNNEKLYGKCKTVGLNNLSQENKILVQYDSLSKKIKIGTPTKENCTLTIYSLSGIRILETIISSNEYSDLNNLSKGLFIFEVETNNGRKCEKIYIQ